MNGYNFAMTANYREEEPIETKIQIESECISNLTHRLSNCMNLPHVDEKITPEFLEVMRLTRCIFERVLRVFSEAEFVDYQQEKFSGRFVE